VVLNLRPDSGRRSAPSLGRQPACPLDFIPSPIASLSVPIKTWRQHLGVSSQPTPRPGADNLCGWGTPARPLGSLPSAPDLPEARRRGQHTPADEHLGWGYLEESSVCSPQDYLYLHSGSPLSSRAEGMLSTRDLPLRVESRKLYPPLIGPFPISKVLSPTAFHLLLPCTLRIHPTFHVSRIKRLPHSHLTPVSRPTSPPVSLPAIHHLAVRPTGLTTADHV
jgi:hypothetical protein